MPDSNYFLGIERSILGQPWRARLSDSRAALAISERLDLPEILGRVLAGRDIALDEAEAFLNPTLRTLMPAPEQLCDMNRGAERIAAAMMHGETIGIIGDYDVDGMTSCAILSLFLKAGGTTPEIHIPNRVTEGYGPSRQAVETLQVRGAQLIVTLDCGVMAHDPMDHAADLGIDTVIVDHHQVSEVLPQALAIINPNRNDDLSGAGYLCAAGVTLILVAAINRVLREAGWWSPERPEPDILQWLDLVALGTVCDVVPLKGLNRAYVTQGLKVMSGRGNTGLTALADAARLNRRPDVYALGFLLGPRLNAAGRIGSAMLGLELLTSSDRGQSMNIAQQLEKLNRERQEIELQILASATAQAEAALGGKANLPILVVSGENWHAGVLGLVASRLRERFDLPCFALGHTPGDATAAGSGRSIPGVDLGAAVQGAVAEGIVVKGGGHAMAAGLTLKIDQIGALRAYLESHLADDVKTAGDLKALEIDGALSASGASIALIEMLERAGPYGSGNPAPVFALPAHRIAYADAAGADHVRCTLQAADGSRIAAIAFRALHTELGEVLLTERGKPLHIAGRLSINDWGGSRKPQLMIADAAFVP
ncbi:MAG: single-stranded-DNA-specific exonuclease RecJ [Rhizobiales bacterium]|nr:single-stranded-DNA-specific exonuclease RecJ [Hyphomicrobiales bacterium]